MTQQLLLDTCALIWTLDDAPFAQDARAEIEENIAQGHKIHVSPMTAWELGMLQSRGKLTSSVPLMARLSRIAALQWLSIGADLLYASNFLPGTPPKDPADRIIIATAREYDLRLVTRDAEMRAYAEAGHVRCLPC